MGHGHFDPTATTSLFKEIVEAHGWHVRINRDTPKIEYDRRRRTIKEHFSNQYSFKERSEWISDYEKLLGETRHDVQLREIHHPSGTTIYYYIVVVKDTEWNARDKTGLAMQHFTAYKNDLKQLLSDLYGDVYRRKGRRMSEKVEIK